MCYYCEAFHLQLSLGSTIHNVTGFELDDQGVIPDEWGFFLFVVGSTWPFAQLVWSLFSQR